MRTNLRKVGGSVMMAVSPVFLEELAIDSGSVVDVAMVDGSLVITPIHKPHYELEELLAQCDAKAKMPREDQAWLNAPVVGNEII